MMSRSCGWEIKSILKVISSSKVEARNKSGRSFTLEQKFHLGSESVSNSFASVLGHLCSVIIFTPHLRLELSMCTFDKYIWGKYTLQKYYWKKYTFKYNICTSSETGALNMHQFCLCCLFWNIFTPGILFIVIVIIFVPHLRLEL